METPGLDLRATNAAAERSVRPYVISWPLAAITVVLLIAVAVLGLFILRASIAAMAEQRAAFVSAIASGRAPTESANVEQLIELGLLAILQSALMLGAVLSFAGWLALVTRNVPLLGGGAPSRSPERTFIYTLIPVFNFFKVPGMLQDLLYRVDPEEGGAFMVIAAVIGIVGSWIMSWFGGWVIFMVLLRNLLATTDQAALITAFSGYLDQTIWLKIVVELMAAVGTILLAAIMIRLESRCAARDREIRAGMALSGAPTVPEGPDWAAQEHDPFASPAPPPATWRSRVEPTYYHSPSPPAVPGAQGGPPKPPPPPPGSQPPGNRPG
jgi:hypothetical protein